MNESVKVNRDMKILSIDDSSEARAILRVLLRKIGFTNVVDANDGDQALQVIADHKYSQVELILADWNMPKLNGFELLKRLRGDARYKEIPFIMVTADSDREHVLLALKSGADNYILKPLSADLVLKKIAETLKKKEHPHSVV